MSRDGKDRGDSEGISSADPTAARNVQAYLRVHAPVLLSTYPQQVGGHALLMELGENVICKPVNSREKFFYESIPQEIRDFTPEYHGIANIRFRRKGDGQIEILAYPGEDANDANHTSKSPRLDSNGTRLHIDSLQVESHRSQAMAASNVASDLCTTAGDRYITPWTAACIENWSKVLEGHGDQLHTLRYDCLLLENLTRRFRSPCILDVKLGQQYGDDADEKKRAQHLMKVANSTCHTLGVRIYGMQVFNACKKEFVYHSKYWGRSLEEGEFFQALRDFIHNGKCYVTEVIPGLVAMLKQLREVILRMDSYRFFSSSLLVVYDGSDHFRNGHTLTNGYVGKDGSLLKGEHRATTLSPSGTCIGSNHALSEAELKEIRQYVDIRMIDFAHTTNGRLPGETIQYNGADENCVLGLSTLITAFEDMLEQLCRTGKN